MSGPPQPVLRPLAPRRRHLLGPTVAAIAVATAILAVNSTMLRHDGDPDADGRGFRLDRDALAPVETAGDDLPPLDHPVPEDLDPHVPPEGAVPAAMAGQSWFVEGFQTAQGWSFRRDTIWRPASIFPILDVAGEGLNVRDGLRQTWTPPTCDCPTVRVWMYGGSTTYGLNQRDDHTIASELARAAWRDGLRLEVENRGVLGYLHWLEAERFAYDLTIDEPPDVALFYDGVNETWAASTLASRHAGDVRMLVDPTNVDVWGYTERSEQPPPPAPPGANLIGWDRGQAIDMRELVHLTMARYDRARQLSRATAQRHGANAIYVWQPTRVSRALVAGEPHGTGPQEREVRLRDQLQRELLADDVIDLVDVFDERRDPIFTDDVHHNELGAALVAEAIYANIEQRLRSIAAGSGGEG